MQYKEKEIKKGIKVHLIKTEKFKTNLIAVFLSMPITRENVTKNSLLSAVLRRGSMNMPTSTDINKQLEEMYGASFDNGLDKTGDNDILNIQDEIPILFIMEFIMFQSASVLRTNNEIVE